jgi:signal peptidase
MFAHATMIGTLIALAVASAVAAAPVALGLRAVVVHGGSMGDSIPSGSLVMARWVSADEVRLGDVILVQEQRDEGPAVPKIHRVVSLEPDGGNILVRTKGDANDTDDPKLYVLPNRVLTPAYHLEYLGFLVGFVSTSHGWLLMITLPGAVLCLLTLRSIWVPEKRWRTAGAWRQ